MSSEFIAIGLINMPMPGSRNSTFIERAVMSADPQEEDVLLSEFDHDLETPPLRPALDEMVAIDVEADLAEFQKPIVPVPVTPNQIEQLFTTSKLLQECGVQLVQESNNVWHSPTAQKLTELPSHPIYTAIIPHYTS